MLFSPAKPYVLPWKAAGQTSDQREIRDRKRVSRLSSFLFMSPISHGAFYNNSSFLSFSFFCPDLDLCGLPAWLLPWQHLEPSSSCWPYVFTEAPACSSLPRGFASPSKVSSYRITNPASDSEGCHLGFCYLFALSTTGARPPIVLPFSTYVKKVFPAARQTVQHLEQKVDVTCGWVLVVPFDQVSTHTLNPARTSVWPVFLIWHDDTSRKHLKFDILQL